MHQFLIKAIKKTVKQNFSIKDHNNPRTNLESKSVIQAPQQQPGEKAVEE